MVVNSHAVTPGAGWSILDAARAAGAVVPTLCHHPALPPDGSCRLCVVEIDGRPGLHPACVEPAVGGARVQTDTPAARAARRNVLALLLHRYRPRPGTQDNELLDLARAHGVTANDAVPGPRAGVDESDPFLRFDPGPRSPRTRSARCGSSRSGLWRSFLSQAIEGGSDDDRESGQASTSWSPRRPDGASARTIPWPRPRSGSVKSSSSSTSKRGAGPAAHVGLAERDEGRESLRPVRCAVGRRRQSLLASRRRIRERLGHAEPAHVRAPPSRHRAAGCGRDRKVRRPSGVHGRGSVPV